MLRSKLVQHIGGLWAGASTVEQRSEFLNPPVLEKTDGFGTRCITLSGPDPLVAKPVRAMLKRIGGDVDLVRRSMLKSREVRQVASDVSVSNGFGDLPVVAALAPQRRDRPRSGRRVRPCPQGRGGEHRLRA